MSFSRLLPGGRAAFRYADPHARSVFVTGSFSGWRAPGVELSRTEGGFAADVEVPQGDVVYKLVVDGRWIADPTNLDLVDDGVGGHNSVMRALGHRGASRHLDFFSPALGERRSYVLHLPPDHASTEARLPVLYLLHGALDWERTWLERGELASTLEALHEEGLRTPIVVMPKEPGALHRGDGRVVDYLARDLVGHIDAELSTIAAPGARALDGLSTGGFTSLVVGAWRPEVFGSIGSMSGSYDARAFDAVRSAAASVRASGQRYVVSCGRDEPHYGTCREMFQSLEGLGVAARWLEVPGPHDWPVWRALLGAHLRQHCERFAA